MTMVKPATFQTTMTIIDQNAVSKSASRLMRPSVRPSLSASGLNRPESTLASQDQSRLAEAKPTTTGKKERGAIEAIDASRALDIERERESDREDRDGHHDRIIGGEAQGVPEAPILEDGEVVVESDVSVLAEQGPVVQRHPAGHAERQQKEHQHQRHRGGDIERAGPSPPGEDGWPAAGGRRRQSGSRHGAVPADAEKSEGDARIRSTTALPVIASKAKQSRLRRRGEATTGS